MGLIYSILASLFVSVRDIYNKKISDKVESIISTLATYLYSFFIFLIIQSIHSLYTHTIPKITSQFIVYIVLRNISDIFAEFFKLKAYEERGELSTVTAFFALSPIVSLVLSSIILKENVKTIALLGIFFVITGNLILSNLSAKTFDTQNIKLVIRYSLLSATFTGSNIIFDKLALQQSTPIFTALALSFSATLIVLPAVLFKNRKNLYKLTKYKKPFLIRSVLETGYMLSKITALLYLSAPIVDTIKKSSVLTNVVLGKVFFQEKKLFEKLIGALLVFLGIMIIIFVK